jgi:hypothetical protein
LGSAGVCGLFWRGIRKLNGQKLDNVDEVEVVPIRWG